MNERNHIYTVSALNNYVKNLLDRDAELMAVSVRGELSNYKAHSSGHHFFSMKDENCTLKCIMYQAMASRLRFVPENGMEVVAMGKVSAFPRDGVYQLYVSAMMPVGVGELQIAFEQMQERLRQAGLFDDDHKKPRPAYPGTVVLITSPVGDAVRDMIHVLQAKWPMAKVRLLPTLVQGSDAAGEISQAIDYANHHHLGDVIILGRGGGTKEDLWCFNEEMVARAVYRSEIPIVTGIGHTPDVSIADLTADIHETTPTNAASAAVPDQNEVYNSLLQTKIRMSRQAGRELSLAREKLRRFSQSRVLTDPMNLVTDRKMLVDRQRERLAAALVSRLAREKQRFAAGAAKLDALSPLKVLGRGYAIPQMEDKVIRSAKELKEGDRFDLRLRDGSVPCRVEKKG